MLRVAKKRRLIFGIIIALVVVVVASISAYVGLMLLLPLPKPTITISVQSESLDTGVAKDMNWPASGSAAISLPDFDIVESNNSGRPIPTASMAKAILAMAVLKQRPIEFGQTGPTLTLTDADYQYYLDEIARQGSIVAVRSGEQLTQYQALQALLLPSGNNMATTLAVWAFGSESKYVEYANNMIKDLGLTNTTIADASGYSASTVSTVEDLVVIGNEAIKDPVLKEIVSQKTATVPVAGRLVNTNSTLGVSGINGIKTGQTTASGDCLLFSATQTIGGEDITLIGVLQAMPGDYGAIEAAPGLVDQGYSNFTVVEGIAEGQIVGSVSVPWGLSVNITAVDKIEQTVWMGTELDRVVEATAAFSGKVGQVIVGDKSTDLVLESSIEEPDAWWRLTHPAEMIKAGGQ
ncbi:MAG: hypothetical protein PVI21_01060 [Candidatus Woesebacteria bacterium]|jgi:D-alanyl-D-alanine carboxypeptidase (penicillin-binding protein 5/6)